MPTRRVDLPPEREHDKPDRIRVYVMTLSCMLCGVEAGALESRTWPMRAGQVIWRRTGKDERYLTIHSTRELRCDRCGGNLITESVECEIRKVEHFDWLVERPRRGRPPIALVHRRQQEAIARAELLGDIAQAEQLAAGY